MEPESVDVAGYWKLLVGGGVLSVMHALIPNHWLPFLLLGKVRGWGVKALSLATLVGGSLHILSTVIIGVFVGWGGKKLFEWAESWGEPLAGLILILVGVVLIFMDRLGMGHTHHRGVIRDGHDDRQGEDDDQGHEHGGSVLAEGATLLSLCFIMFLSPCLELEAYYIQAATLPYGILGLSAVYFLVTVPAMVGVVLLARLGVERIRFSFLEEHERMLAGIVLLVMGIVVLFVRHGHA